LRLLLYALLVALFPATQLCAAESGVITLYHHVARDTPASTSISPEDFREHLDYLRNNDFSVIALDTMLETLKAGQQLPDKAVAITFDDGYSSIYDTAFPMLQEYGFPFTLFLSTGPINNGQSNYMNWDQIKEMADAGVIIANHMVEHPYMLELINSESEQQWLERLEVELLQAEKDIEEHTGQSHRYLAYPYGEYNKAIKDMLIELGFIGLAQNSGAVNASTDFLAIPRFPLASIYANLDTARTKFESLAFKVSQLDPDTPVTNNHSPMVTLQFAAGNYNFDQINCFAENEAIPLRWIDEENGLVELVPTSLYNGRRWRYICTAPALNTNRFYWYSVQWIDPAR
jgi:peptidoglycan/xylan/chitin deacetylase (PgdA/CDA1 family)